mgnify:CR=1 FL=1
MPIFIFYLISLTNKFNIMKNLNLILLAAFALILYSCSSDDDNNNIDNGNGDIPSGELFIKKIESPHWNNESDIFHYENDILKFIEYCENYNNVSYFEYNGSNKVSKEYQFVDENFDVNTVNIDAVINDPETNVNEYIYEDGKAIRIDINGSPNTFFSYNENGLLIHISENYYPNNSYLIHYEDNKITQIAQTYFGDTVIHTYVFDDKISPIYELFNHYGILVYSNCIGYRDFQLLYKYPLFKNNVLTKTVDGNSKIANYLYLENNRPEAIIMTDWTGTQYSEFFTY